MYIYVYMNIYIYLYEYTYIYVYVYIYKYICKPMYGTYLCVCLYACVCAYMCVYKYTYTRVCLFSIIEDSATLELQHTAYHYSTYEPQTGAFRLRSK